MRLKLIIATATLMVVGSPAYAGGGWLRDVLADTLHDAGQELLVNGITGLANSLANPAPQPTVVVPAPAYTVAPAVLPAGQPDDSAAYTAWLMQRVGKGAIYNRPCTFSDGVSVTPVRCPFPSAPVVQAAPVVQTAALVQPDEEQVVDEGPSYYYVGGRRYYRSASFRGGRHFVRSSHAFRAPRFHAPRFQAHRPVASFRAPVRWKRR